jgi:hypothetical protein
MGFPSAVLVRQGQSITGSFNRIQALESGSASTVSANIIGLRDGDGNSFSLSSGISTSIFLPPGAIMELMITSASLGATSAPVIFYKI